MNSLAPSILTDVALVRGSAISPRLIMLWVANRVTIALISLFMSVQVDQKNPIPGSHALVIRDYIIYYNSL